MLKEETGEDGDCWTRNDMLVTIAALNSQLFSGGRDKERGYAAIYRTWNTTSVPAFIGKLLQKFRYQHRT